IRGLTTVVLANTLLMSLAIVAFAATDEFLLALPCVFVAGAAMVITGIGAQTLIQASVDHGMSGRGMALYGMILRARPALGAVAVGAASPSHSLRWGAWRARHPRTYPGRRLPLAVGAVLSIGCLALTLTRRRAIAVALES